MSKKTKLRHGVNLTIAIAALRNQVKARRSGDSDLLKQANLDVKAQEPCSSQVRQALINNDEGMTLSKVTPGWVRARLNKKRGKGEKTQELK